MGFRVQGYHLLWDPCTRNPSSGAWVFARVVDFGHLESQ